MDAVMNWLWQGSVVAAAAFVMLRAMGRASAGARYGVCWAALLLILALPLLPLLPFQPLQPLQSFFPFQPLHTLLPVQPFETLQPLPPLLPVLPLQPRWTFVLGAAWLAWASVQLARFIYAVVAIRRARTRSHAFPSHLESALLQWHRVTREGRRARLVLSNAVTSAAVFGWGAPMIAVAPSLVRTLAPEDLDRVLIHEWAHVQRRDDFANIAQIVVRIVAGWHPALWWIDRRLHIEREIACDEIAVGITGSPKSYAECLLKVSAVPSSPMAMLMAPAVFGSGLRARIVKIVSPRPLLAPLGSRGLAAAIVLVLCVVAVVAGGRTVVDATPFVAPAVSTAVETLRIPSGVPVPDTRRVEEPRTTRPPRRALDRSSLSPRTEHVQLPLSPQTPPSVEPAAPPSVAPHQPDESRAPDSPHVAEAVPQPPPAVAPAATSVPETPQPPPVADAGASPPQTPWGAAAAGGTAVGRSSKNAGVATAGFFTRFAKRVAGSF